jgi:hypothetical protein
MPFIPPDFSAQLQGRAMPSMPKVQPSLMERLQMGLLGPQQSYGGLLSEEDQKAARQQGLLALGAQLMSAGGESPTRVSFGQALGPALMAGQQAQGAAGQDMLQAMLLKTKLQQKEKRGKPVPVVGPDGKTVYMYPDEAIGQEVPKGIGNQAELPADMQGYNLAKSQGFKGSYIDYLNEIAKARVGTPYMPMTVGGVPGFGNRQDASFTPAGSLPNEVNAAAQVKEAEARAAELAKAQAGRDATFQEDMNVIDDEILRTQRLLSEFESGKYQTGPLAGKLPNVRTAAQDLQREQGKDVIKAISSATFGALSEGEREFLRTIGVSESATEESNMNMLTERLAKLKRTKERLQTRGRLGVGPNAAPSAAPGERPPLSSFQK